MFFDEEEEYQPVGKRVQLRPYIPRPPKTFELLTDAEIRQYRGGVLLFDTEVFPNYFLIGFKHVGTGKYIVLELSPTHRFDPKQLAYIMQCYTCVGFNSHHFDIPMVWLAHMRQDNKYLSQMAQTIITHDMRRFEIEELGKFKCYPTKHVDLMEVAPLKGSLKTYGGRLHSERMLDLPFDPTLPLSYGEAMAVKDYNLTDLDVTELMMENLEEELTLRAVLGKEYKQDLLSKSDAQIAEYVIASEIERITGKRPKKPEKQQGAVHKYNVPDFMKFKTPFMQQVLKTVADADYVVAPSGKVIIPDEIKELNIVIGHSTYRMGNGGLHSSEKEVSHIAKEGEKIFDRDVASYYPRIVLNQKLMPQHLGENFLTVYDAIVERRLKAKKAKQKAIAQGLKITVNGAFGKLGSSFSVLYAPDLMIQVTVSGQLCLLMLIEMLELQGIEVISANTDGVVMKVRDDQYKTYLQTIAEWEQVTNFKTEETEYSAVYSRDINAYMAVKVDTEETKIEINGYTLDITKRKNSDKKTIKGKNVYFNPWDAGKDYAIFRFHKNPMATVCILAIEKLLTENVPIEETIKSETDIKRFVCVKNVRGGGHKDQHYLGKVVRWYYAKNTPGMINYVIGNKKVGESEGGKPCMDMPTTLPDDIDYDAYIKRTIGLLQNMGYYKRVKDLSFF